MWIKICGIRDVETALAVAQCGATAIGLNFYARSPRCVDPQVAAEIVRQLPASVEPVGLFVNHTVDEIVATCEEVGLCTVQLHGDEPPQFLRELNDRSLTLRVGCVEHRTTRLGESGYDAATAPLKIIRAFRVGDEGLSAMAAYLDACRELGARPAASLVDARVAGQYGGTGHAAPWELLRREYRTGEWPPLILAGGLTPKNVAEAIQIVRPWGVDVAGGVESAVACKDMDLVRQFVDAVVGDPFLVIVVWLSRPNSWGRHSCPPS